LFCDEAILITYFIQCGKTRNNCAEFKYVASFCLYPSRFLSDAQLKLEKTGFTSYYRQYIHYINSNSGWLSATFCLWNVCSKRPAMLSQHIATPLALVSLFHGGNVLVKSLSVLFLRISTSELTVCLSVCDWAHMPTVFVMTKLSCPRRA